MPQSFSRVQFSITSTPGDGQPIPVLATASPGTAIHTAVPGLAAFDALFLYATNVTSLAATLTIEFGGMTIGNHVAHSYTISPNSPPILIVDGLTLNNGLLVRAFSDVAAAINISGYVDRIQ